MITVEALEASREFLRLTLETLKKYGIHIEEETSKRLGSILESISFDIFTKNNTAGKLKLAMFRQLLKSFQGARGLSIKAMQLASFLELGLPAEITNLLGDLQNSGQPMPATKVQEILNVAYGGDKDRFFSQISMKPLIVTSLAQIHLATLATGEKVAIKIRHSGVEEILEGQFKKLSIFTLISRLTGRSAEEIFSEIQHQVTLEADYEREVYNQERFRNIFEHDSKVVIPKIYRDLCRKNIIVSHYEQGIPFAAFCARAIPEERKQAALLISYFHIHSAFERNLIHADAHPGNFLFRNDKVIFLDFGRIIEVDSSEIAYQKRLYASILQKNKNKTIQILKDGNVIRNPESFDFEGFWRLLLLQQAHQLTDSFKITRDHLKLLRTEEQNFRDRGQLVLNKTFLNAAIVNVSLMSLFAALEVEVPWREQALTLACPPDLLTL